VNSTAYLHSARSRGCLNQASAVGDFVRATEFLYQQQPLPFPIKLDPTVACVPRMCPTPGRSRFGSVTRIRIIERDRCSISALACYRYSIKLCEIHEH
jgi:hypothetical protein